MKYGFRVVCTALIAIALATVFYIVVQRIQWDRNNRQYSTGIRYRELQNRARSQRRPLSALIDDLQKRGLTTIILTANGLNQGVIAETKDKKDSLAETDLDTMLELRHWNLITTEDLQKVKELRSTVSPAGLLFQEETCRFKSDLVSEWLTEDPTVIGALEFRGQKIALHSSRGSPSQAVRFHRIFEEELPLHDLDYLTSRYVRAVKERNIGVIEYRLSPEFSWEQNLEALSEIRSRLSQHGFRAVGLKEAKGAKTLISPSPLLLVPISSAIFLMVTLLLSSTFSSIPSRGTAAAIVPTGVALSTWGILSAPVFTRQVLALLLTTIGPLIGYLVLKRYIESRTTNRCFSRAPRGAETSGEVRSRRC